MSGSGDDSGEKTHEPTSKKLDDQRRKGDIPKSTDLTTAAVYGGFILAMFAFGPAGLSHVGLALASLLDHADSLSRIWFRDSAAPLSSRLAKDVLTPLTTWFGLPALAALTAIVAQRALVFAPEKLLPKLDRISILSNARNKFGRAGLFEFAKSFAKLSIYAGVLGYFLTRQQQAIIGTAQLNSAMALSALAQLSLQFFSIILAVAVAIGVVDLLWQHNEHRRKNRMSRKELADENKQTEGDPHAKRQRRQRGYDIAMNKMLADVETADVVVVNPEHYAVALKWSRNPGCAPVCVAKGVDEIAARIREIAAGAAVPVHRDPPTARELFAVVEIGQEIEPRHYRAVAAAIRFAEAMRSRARTGMR